MCSCEGGDPCDVYVIERRRARKKHECSECSGGIRPGEAYVYFRFLFDGFWDTERRCSSCDLKAKAFKMAEGCNAPFGGLMETIRECAEEDPDFVKAWLRARRQVRGEFRVSLAATVEPSR